MRRGLYRRDPAAANCKRALILESLLGGEEPGVSPIRPDAQPHLALATWAATLIGGTLGIAIDPRVDPAAVEVNADPRTATQVSALASRFCRIFEALDIQAVRRRIFHQVIYRL